MAKVLSAFFALVWVIVLVGFFLPILGVGYGLRALGTIICNLAFKIQAGMEWLGERVAHQLPP